MEADKIKATIKLAARELFRRYGYKKTSVNDIAKRAKLAKATIYKYFESKEMVLHAILMDYIQDSVDELLAKYEQQQAEIQEVRHQLRDILADALSHNSNESTNGGAA